MKMQERDRIIREQAENKGRIQGLLEGKAEGKQEGRMAAIQSFICMNQKEGVSEEELFALLQKYFQLTPEESDELLHGTE